MMKWHVELVELNKTSFSYTSERKPRHGINIHSSSFILCFSAFFLLLWIFLSLSLSSLFQSRYVVLYFSFLSSFFALQFKREKAEEKHRQSLVPLAICHLSSFSISSLTFIIIRDDGDEDLSTRFNKTHTKEFLFLFQLIRFVKDFARLKFKVLKKMGNAEARGKHGKALSDADVTELSNISGFTPQQVREWHSGFLVS